MRVKCINLSLLSIFLFVIFILPPAHAQMGQWNHSGSESGQGMVQGYDFAQYDGRFNGFGSMTLREVSDTFGVPVKDAIYDLELPEDLDTQLTVLEIEELYGVSGQEIAGYVVMNMQETNASLNSSEKLLLRQQAIHAMRTGKGKGMFFMRQGNFACGNFTTFNFNRSGIIKNFAVGGNLLFDSVEISDFEYLDEQVTEISAFYQDVDSQILVQDSPAGVFQVRAFADKTITFNLADGVKAISEENISGGLENAVPIKVTADSFDGYLFDGYLVFFRNPCAEDPRRPINGTEATISENKIIVKLVADSVVMFRANPVQPLLMKNGYQYSSDHAYTNRVLNREIATGRFGAEISFRENSEKVSITNYAPVNLKVRDRDRDSIVLCIESELPDGRVVNINVDNETINLTNPEKLRIRYDGEEVEEASSIDELFEDQNKSLYYTLEENGIASIAIYIPESSEHEIIIDLAPENRQSAAGLLEIENTALSGNEVSGAKNGITGKQEGTLETGEPEAQNEGNETELSPAFELGFAVAGIAAIYGLRRRE